MDNKNLAIKIFPSKQVYINDKLVSLSEFECNLLVALYLAKGEPVRKDELISKAWEGRVVSPISLTVAIKKLRDLIQSAGGDNAVITTCKGIGYAMVFKDGFTLTLAKNGEEEPKIVENNDNYTSVITKPILIQLIINKSKSLLITITTALMFVFFLKTYILNKLNTQKISCDATKITSTSGKVIQCNNLILTKGNTSIYYSYNENDLLIICSKKSCEYQPVYSYVKNSLVKK